MAKPRTAAKKEAAMPAFRSADKPAGQAAQKPPKKGEISKQAPKKA